MLGVEDVLAVDGHPGAGLVIPPDQLGDLVLIDRPAGKAAAGGVEGGLEVDARLGGEGVGLGDGHQIGAGVMLFTNLVTLPLALPPV